MAHEHLLEAAKRSRPVHGALLLALLLAAGCGRATPGTSGPPSVATTTPGAEDQHAADTQVQQAELDCITASGWPLAANPGTEQFGVQVADLANSDPAAAAAISTCQTSGLGATAPAPDVPDDVLATATEANRQAFEGCMEDGGYHPRVDDSMTVDAGYGFAFTYPDDETSRSSFGTDVGRCGDVGAAAQESIVQEYLDSVGG